MGPDEHDASWEAWQSTPWGRLRYRVVSETVTQCVDELGRRPLRVLDVGGADGADSVPLAAAGHAVTVLDRSPSLLARARERAAMAGVDVVTVEADLDELSRINLDPFDVVLCHNVLQYHRDTESAVALIADQVAPAGLVSVLCPNPSGDVLDTAVRLEDPALAVTLLDATTKDSITFGTATTRLEAAEVREHLGRHGFGTVSQFGVLAVTTYIADDDRKSEPDFFAALEALELALRDREPYVRTARFWHLVARRG